MFFLHLLLKFIRSETFNDSQIVALMFFASKTSETDLKIVSIVKLYDGKCLGKSMPRFKIIGSIP